MWPAVRGQHRLPQGKGDLGRTDTLGRASEPRGKDVLFFPDRLQGTLPGPTHLPTHAGREGGDSESARWPCPTAGDPVVTATVLVWVSLRKVDPSTLRRYEGLR